MYAMRLRREQAQAGEEQARAARDQRERELAAARRVPEPARGFTDRAGVPPPPGVFEAGRYG